MCRYMHKELNININNMLLIWELPIWLLPATKEF